ncbi:MAG: tRNA pseudouridine(38-40) synthase TruA [Flavobacteriales bacterium]|nr:tRNA pseudouridine(38-40) synthase TruA [Flavobacteriales bacterium]
MRYFIELAYLGTQYSGWQAQPEGQGVGIQTVISSALSTILRTQVTIVGAGRTDAGVHAHQMYAHMDLEKDIPDSEMFIGRLNSFLPQDIAIRRIFKVKDTAHARFDATSRTYIYTINTRKDPFHIPTSHYFFHPLDIEAMNSACDILTQYTDFQCFSKVNTDVKTYICHLSYAHWDYDEKSGTLLFTISADRFLRNMVRAIVGTMLDIGRARMMPCALHDIIESRNRCSSGMSAPACGLSLVKVNYPWDDILA